MLLVHMHCYGCDSKFLPAVYKMTFNGDPFNSTRGPARDHDPLTIIFSFYFFVK